MIDKHQQALAARYVLDSLDDTERAQFESALAADRELAALVQTLRESFAASPGRYGKSVQPASFNLRLWLGWAVAACIAGVAAVLGQRYLFSETEAALLRDQNATVEIALKSVQNENDAAQLIARRQLDTLNQQLAAAQERLTTLQRQLQMQGNPDDLRIVTLASRLQTAPQAGAVVVWNPALQEGVLHAEMLPAPAADYMNWRCLLNYASFHQQPPKWRTMFSCAARKLVMRTVAQSSATNSGPSHD